MAATGIFRILKFFLLLGWVYLQGVGCTPSADKVPVGSNLKEQLLSESDLTSLDSPLNNLSLGELATNSSQILGANCLTCHSAGGSGTAAIDNIADTTALLENGYIVPGEPINSVLFKEILAGTMPPGGPALSKEDRDNLQFWIFKGVTDVKPVISYETNVQRIVIDKCVSCHSLLGGNVGGINMETLAGVMEFVPAGKTPEETPFFDSVVTGRMPDATEKLTTQELAIIYNWIWAGANP